MDKNDYSFQAFIVENGKKISSTLTLFPDKYEFNGLAKKINWEKASCTTGKTKVKTFILFSEKPFVVIKEGVEYSPIFVMEQDQIDDLIVKVNELSELIRQKRIEEEERRYKEAEEQKRLEEEDKRRKAEEERKRCEEERKRKEEEEHKRLLALAKKLNEKKDRIVKEVDDSRSFAWKLDISGDRNTNFRKAWSNIADNPYRVLGISVAASKEEANATLDKIKKLSRLNAVASYKTDFHLNGTNKPERDISIIQNALTITKDIKYKWFWFLTPDACIAWQNEQYRKELLYDGPENATYDMFLANYYYALFFDPSFEKPILWKPVFSFFTYICSEDTHVLIKSRFNNQELRQIQVSEAVQNFKNEIFKPLEIICDSEDVALIIRLYLILKEIANGNLIGLKKIIMSKLTKWFAVREESICKLVNESDEDHIITDEEAKEISIAGDRYIGEVDKALESALSTLRDEPVRYEMIKESYRHATWQVMFALNKAEYKDKAIDFANKCYPYCNENDKRKIRNVFGMNVIKGADRDATNAEWDIMGDNYYFGKNGYEQDYNEAFRWYKKAAEAGNMYSQNSLGVCFKEGNGTYQSDYEAAKWFEKAYKSGNPDGACNLAKCYALGEGKAVDKKKAIDLYLEAAKMGHPNAAEMGKNLLNIMILEQKMHRLTQHEHYDLGFQIPIGETIIVEVTLNYSANVYLMEGDAYKKYLECENFSYYGGRATQSPYRVRIPHTGTWHLVIDNGDNDMTGIITSVRTRTFNI